jgi:hypothetical protein
VLISGGDNKSKRSSFLRDKDMWLKKVFEDRKLKSTDKNIAWAISSYMNADSRQAWPSHKRLAQMCGVGIRTSEYGTRNLEAAGYLTVSRRASCNNRYEMTVPHALAVSEAVPGHPIPHVPAVDTAQTCGVIPHVPAPEPLTELLTEPFQEEAPPSSSALEGHSSVVALEDSRKEEREGVGEHGSEGPKSGEAAATQSEPFPRTDTAFGSATQIYTVPPKISPAPKKLRFDMAEFSAEMSARGMNMDQSRRRRP